jgi:hypothetical protein
LQAQEDDVAGNGAWHAEFSFTSAKGLLPLSVTVPDLQSPISKFGDSLQERANSPLLSLNIAYFNFK